jgi:hypothetical protein
MKAQLLLILIVSALCILSCSDSDVAPAEIVDESIWKDTVSLDCKLDTTSSLDSLLAFWKANEPSHYSYQVVRYCFCDILVFQFEVKNGIIDSIYYGSEEGDYAYLSNSFPELLERLLITDAPRWYTIEALFETLEEGRSENPFYHTSYFNEQYGFPCSFSFDPEEDWHDDEYAYEILNFTIAEP